MKQVKLANENGHEARIGGSASSAHTDQMNTLKSGGKKAGDLSPPTHGAGATRVIGPARSSGLAAIGSLMVSPRRKRDSQRSASIRAEHPMA
jgi:hypothetical protein